MLEANAHSYPLGYPLGSLATLKNLSFGWIIGPTILGYKRLVILYRVLT